MQTEEEREKDRQEKLAAIEEEERQRIISNRKSRLKTHGECRFCIGPDNNEHNKNGKCHKTQPRQINSDNFDYPEVDPSEIGCGDFEE